MPHEAELAELARLYRVQTEYWDANGTRRRPSDESVMAIMATLGASLAARSDLPGALVERKRELWGRLAEPVAAAIAGEPIELSLRAPAWAVGLARATLETEGGEIRVLDFELGMLPTVFSDTVDGEDRRERRLILSAVPAGYHLLRIESGGTTADVLVIAAPRRAPDPERARGWGVFLPLYAMRSRRTVGIADVGDLARMLDGIDALGGDLVGSTPLFASFPHEPSPYAPASRLFWHELYAELGASPELEDSPAARDLLASAAFQGEGRALAAAPYVDYDAALALRRPVLELLATALYAAPSSRRDAFERHLRTTPDLVDYARFRATGEARGSGWHVWPEVERNGTLSIADDDPAFRYHSYGQWLVDEQLRELAGRAGAGLYLDQPLGVHADSYDTWRERESFALGASGGAPPDVFFAEGQEWGFPPLDPNGIRSTQHRYPIACLRRILSRSKAVRIDHVMGLHRLFWIPRGFSATDGAYVEYPADELYAIVCLEAQRQDAMVVGEDLGTVPDGVREMMESRGLRRSYVLQFALQPDAEHAMDTPPTASLASANTHDTPPFAAFWRDADPALRDALVHYLVKRGRLPETGEPDSEDVLRASLDELATGDAETVLVNVEDMWGELEPQNVPGTSGEGALNWRRRARYGLEEMLELPAVRDTLRHIDGLRKQGISA
jgi:4-alpha-glucanotransferase